MKIKNKILLAHVRVLYARTVCKIFGQGYWIVQHLRTRLRLLLRQHLARGGQTQCVASRKQGCHSLKPEAGSPVCQIKESQNHGGSEEEPGGFGTGATVFFKSRSHCGGSGRRSRATGNFPSILVSQGSGAKIHRGGIALWPCRLPIPVGAKSPHGSCLVNTVDKSSLKPT